jgi:hypothetical protein
MCQSLRQIEIIWSVEDVRVVRQDLSDDQCMRVLQRVQQNHDAQYGITWEIIQTCAETIFPR